jgi:glutathione synthase/RimK-type ligase-like ATP-grasp enzyme
MIAAEGIEVAGIEFVEDAEGRRYTYDINGTTNYSGALARQTGIDGMRELARYVKRQVRASLGREAA